MGGCLSKRKREENIIEALAVQMPDVFYYEILPKLDMTDTLNLAQVSKRYNDAVWSVDGVRSMEAKIEAKIKAASTSSCSSKLLYWTARHGNVSAVRAILKSWVYVNVSHHDCTPLHLATHYGHTPVVKALIEAGADVAMRGSRGFTSLHWAACKGHAPVITELIKAGADVNATDDDGLVPLHYAVECRHEDCVVLLLAHGADVNQAENRWKCTPMRLAVYREHKKIIKKLKQAGG